jgi:preprotein translocase subunit SecG
LLTVLILLQVKGGGLGNLLGGDVGGGIARTRRGLEKTLFQVTIGLAIAFITVSILSVVFTR